MTKNLFVDIKIKESRGEFSPVIDHYKGDIDEGAKFLLSKYSNKKHKNLFEWLYGPFDVINGEFRK